MLRTSGSGRHYLTRRRVAPSEVSPSLQFKTVQVKRSHLRFIRLHTGSLRKSQNTFRETNPGKHTHWPIKQQHQCNDRQSTTINNLSYTNNITTLYNRDLLWSLIAFSMENGPAVFTNWDDKDLNVNAQITDKAYLFSTRVPYPYSTSPSL